MMRPKNLKSLIALVTHGGRSALSGRNLSSCPNCGHVSKEAVVTAVPNFIFPRVAGAAMGYGLGYLLLQPSISRIEKVQRQYIPGSRKITMVFVEEEPKKGHRLTECKMEKTSREE